MGAADEHVAQRQRHLVLHGVEGFRRQIGQFRHETFTQGGILFRISQHPRGIAAVGLRQMLSHRFVSAAHLHALDLRALQWLFGATGGLGADAKLLRQPFLDIVGQVLPHQPLDGQFAAGDGDEARFVLHSHVLAGECGRVAGGGHERAQAGKGADDVVVFDLHAREGILHRLQQIFDVGERGSRVVQVALIIGVGGADEGKVAPGDEKDVAAVVLDTKDDGVLTVQSCAGDEQVNPFGRADHWPRVSFVQFAHAVRPDAGGVDDDPRSRLDLLPAHLIHDVSADDAPSGFHQPGHAGVIDHHRAVEVGSLDSRQRQAGVVHLGVIVAGSAEQSPAGDQRLAPLHLRRVQPAVTLDVTEETQPIVHRHPDAEFPGRRFLSPVEWVEESQRSHQPGSGLAHQTPLAASIEYQFEFAILQITNAAVDEPCGATAGATAKVILLDQGGVEAAHCRIAGHRRAGDAAADDQQVELFLSQASHVLPANGSRERAHRVFFHSCFLYIVAVTTLVVHSRERATKVATTNTLYGGQQDAGVHNAGGIKGLLECPQHL